MVICSTLKSRSTWKNGSSTTSRAWVNRSLYKTIPANVIPKPVSSTLKPTKICPSWVKNPFRTFFTSPNSSKQPILVSWPYYTVANSIVPLSPRFCPKALTLTLSYPRLFTLVQTLIPCFRSNKSSWQWNFSTREWTVRAGTTNHATTSASVVPKTTAHAPLKTDSANRTAGAKCTVWMLTRAVSVKPGRNVFRRSAYAFYTGGNATPTSAKGASPTSTRAVSTSS